MISLLFEKHSDYSPIKKDEMSCSVKYLTLPTSIEVLEYDTLENYDKVKVLTISHNFAFDDDKAGPFSHLKSLREFRVTSHNLRVYVEDGILYTNDSTWLYEECDLPQAATCGKILLAVPPAYPTEHLVIPEGVSLIYSGALNGCRFKTVTLPDSLEVIDFYALNDIEGLECIRVPNKYIEVLDQWITDVKYESKDGCALDKEVCELWDFWTIPTTSYPVNEDDGERWVWIEKNNMIE